MILGQMRKVSDVISDRKDSVFRPQEAFFLLIDRIGLKNKA